MDKEIGMVIFYDDGTEKRIFLEKPEGASWTGTFSIPKTELSSSPFSTLRNYMYDEYKIVLRQNDIPRVASPFKIRFYDDNDEETVELQYYLVRINTLKLMKINNFIFPKYRLPDHIEWAALVPWNQSWSRVEKDQKKLLKYVELLMRNDWDIYNKFYNK